MAISREMKVGAFVLAGLLGAGGIIFLIGDNRSLFDSKVPFRIQFDDVQGVKPGSTVRMGGVDIGTVSRVQYPADPGQAQIEVELSVVKREASRIREGSKASIAAKGLLGDKMVAIVAGPPDRPPIPAGGEITSEPAQDFTQALGKIDQLAGSAQSVLANLDVATGTLADDQVRGDVRRGVAALSHILVSLDSGPGYAARLMHDPGEAERLSNTLANLERMSARLDRVLAGVDEAVERVNRGPGLAHEVLYGESGNRAIAQVGGAAEELGKVLAGVRTGNGLAHGVLFGADGGDSVLGDQLAGDLTNMSSDLRSMLSDLRQGKGTLGALLVDPSVYEDLKMLLGNVQRNQALRALVRYSIRRDDGSPGVEVVDPAPPEKEVASSVARDGKAASAKGTAAKGSNTKTEAAAASKSPKAAQR
jgi:phospholipid/cholesterol/gamma-HCH transport system substrate-binding protein